jgi:monofunctional biosynthetic peptidoglycan transglycosylase
MNKLIALIIIIMPNTINDGPGLISNFEKDSNDIRWYTVNDGVMGGLSRGIFQYTENGTGVFRGDLSLENNGGFSWLKAVNSDMDIKDSEGIKIRLKGDGRKYALTLKNPDRRRVMYFASFFETREEEWQEIELPLKSFKGYFYGQNVNAVSSMNRENMKEIGIILLDKKQGPFQLEIDWVKTY